MHPQKNSPKSLLIAAAEPEFSPTKLVGWRSRSQLYGYGIMTCFVLGFGLLFIGYRRRDKGAGRGLPSAAAQLQEVVSLLRKALKQAEVENHYRYLVELDHLLRRFILLQLHLSGVHVGGSGVLFVSRIAPFLEVRLLSQLTQIWAEIDRVIASERSVDSEIVRLRDDLVEWLRQYSQAQGESYGF